MALRGLIKESVSWPSSWVSLVLGKGGCEQHTERYKIGLGDIWNCEIANLTYSLTTYCLHKTEFENSNLGIRALCYGNDK